MMISRRDHKRSLYQEVRSESLFRKAFLGQASVKRGECYRGECYDVPASAQPPELSNISRS